ncbi:MAG: hypothetical protein ACRD1R_01425 [Acidobacteriota bacterium]
MANQKYPEYQGPTGQGPRHRHENSGVNIKYLAYFAVGLFISVVVIHLVLAGMFFFLDAMRQDTAELPVVGGPMAPPEPRLQVSPSMDLDVFRAEIEAVLNSYGWVDQERGVARIPVEKAMDLILEKGLLSSAQSGPADQQGDENEQ